MQAAAASFCPLAFPGVMWLPRRTCRALGSAFREIPSSARTAGAHEMRGDGDLATCGRSVNLNDLVGENALVSRSHCPGVRLERENICSSRVIEEASRRFSTVSSIPPDTGKFLLAQ